MYIADYYNFTPWEFFTLPDGLLQTFEWLIAKSSNPLNNPTVSVPRAPIIIGINVTSMFHCFFDLLASSKHLSLLLTFFQFYSVVSLDCKVHNFASSLFFLLIIIRSDRLAMIRWSVCMLKSYRSLCISFSRTTSGLCMYYLFIWSSLHFLHNSLWITLSTVSSLILFLR